MNPDSLSPLLKNYMDLLHRVDAHIRQVEKKYSDKIACKKGCDSCCRILTLFPVEAVFLSAAFCKMDTPRKERVMAGLNEKPKNCPLLIDRQCLLYAARPIICRTHGYPLYFEKNGKHQVDFCPKNFKGMASFPNEILLDLEQLNTLLAAINKQFLAAIKPRVRFADRIPMSSALVLLDKMEDQDLF